VQAFKVSVILRQSNVDDEYTTYDTNTYYAIAHNINESITEQPTMLTNGKLKEYQVSFCLMNLRSYLRSVKWLLTVV